MIRGLAAIQEMSNFERSGTVSVTTFSCTVMWNSAARPYWSSTIARTWSTGSEIVSMTLNLPRTFRPANGGLKSTAHAGLGERDDAAATALDGEHGSDVQVGILPSHLGESGDLMHREQFDEVRVALAEGVGGGELLLDLLSDA